jgi:membrane protein DedA with SNARE-associated domain
MDDPATLVGLQGRPVWLVLLALWAVVLLRSHATYWVGRAVAHGAKVETQRRIGPTWWLAALDRVDAWSQTPSARRGLDRVHRFGPYAVAPAYLTVGLQTATVLSAGLVSMPYRRFIPASLVGGAGWAILWGSAGFVVLDTASWVLRQPWGMAALIALAVAVVALVFMRRSRRDGQAQVVTAP